MDIMKEKKRRPSGDTFLFEECINLFLYPLFLFSYLFLVYCYLLSRVYVYLRILSCTVAAKSHWPFGRSGLELFVSFIQYSRVKLFSYIIRLVYGRVFDFFFVSCSLS